MLQRCDCSGRMRPFVFPQPPGMLAPITPQEREAFVSGAVAAIGAAVVELHGSEAAEILDELLPLPAIVDTVRTHIHYSVHLQSYDPEHCCVHRRQSILAHPGLKARDNKHRFRPLC